MCHPRNQKVSALTGPRSPKRESVENTQEAASAYMTNR